MDIFPEVFVWFSMRFRRHGYGCISKKVGFPIIWVMLDSSGPYLQTGHYLQTVDHRSIYVDIFSVRLIKLEFVKSGAAEPLVALFPSQ